MGQDSKNLGQSSDSQPFQSQHPSTSFLSVLASLVENHCCAQLASVAFKWEYSQVKQANLAHMSGAQPDREAAAHAHSPASLGFSANPKAGRRAGSYFCCFWSDCAWCLLEAGCEEQVGVEWGGQATTQASSTCQLRISKNSKLPACRAALIYPLLKQHQHLHCSAPAENHWCREN